MPRLNFSMRGLLAGTAVVALGCGALVSASDFIGSLVLTIALITLLFAVVAAAMGSGRARAFWIGFAIFGLGYFLLARERLTNAYLLVDAGYGTTALQEYPLLTTKSLAWVHRRWLAPPLPMAVPVAAYPSVPVYTYSVVPAPSASSPPASVTDSSGDSAAPEAPAGDDSFAAANTATGSQAPVATYTAPSYAAPTYAAPPMVMPSSSRPTFSDFMRVGESLYVLLLACAGGILACWFYDRQQRGANDPAGAKIAS